MLADIDWSAAPKKFDKVVVSVEVSIPRPGREPLLGSWSLVDTRGHIRDEVNNDVSPGNIRVTYYYFQSLNRLTGLEEASRYTNLRTKFSFDQMLEEFSDSIKLIKGINGDIMPRLDRRKLQNVLDDNKQLSLELNLLVQDWMRKLNSQNWIRFTYFLAKQFDLVIDFIENPDNGIALIEKTYKEKRQLIDVLQKESIEYVNSKDRWLAIAAGYTEMYALMFYNSLLQTNVDVIIFYREFIRSRKWRNVLFCAVDLDLIDHSVFETPPSDNIRIQRFISGRCEISDLMASERSGNGNVAIYNGEWRKIEPATRALLKAVCPGHYTKRSCKGDVRTWLCVICKLPLFYVFELGIFCDQCGGGLRVEDFSFRCDDIEHIYPIPLTKEQCHELNALTPIKEINILLLGPYTVNKLPWINSLCKYMSLKLLKSWGMRDATELIPSKFVIADRLMQLKTVNVREGVNKNSNSAGKAGCQIYHLVMGDVLFNLIDTPGLSCEGDGRTIKIILDYVRNIDVLHGISVFFHLRVETVSQGYNRYTTSTMYPSWLSLKEILSNLHHNAARNLTFCFNNSIKENSDEERLSELRKLFKELQVDFDMGSRMFKFWDHWLDEWRYFNDDDFSNDAMYDRKRESSLEATRLLQTVSTFDPLFLNYARPNPSAV